MTSAAELIRQSYILAHVISPNEVPEGFLITEGLRFLNETISLWGSEGIYIPYEQYISQVLTAGTYIYPFTLVIAEISQANILSSDNLQIPIKIATDKDFNLWNYNIPNLQSRPVSVYLSKTQFFPDPTSSVLGSQIYLYPTPNIGFTLNLILKYYLQPFTLSQEILNLPPYYFKVLRYQLASDLSILHSTKLPDRFPEEYNSLMGKLKSRNPEDMSVITSNPFESYRKFRPWGYYVG